MIFLQTILLQDNLFEWEVELSDFPAESMLAKDLVKYATRTGRKPVVTMSMKFPKDYPMNPPFVRVLRPKFKFLTGEYMNPPFVRVLRAQVQVPNSQTLIIRWLHRAMIDLL